MTIELFEQAKTELALVFRYYEKRVSGVGFQILDDFENCLNRLLLFPLSSPAITKRVRKAVLSHYPFNIIYYIRNETIFVVAFMHQKRKPGYWKKRIKP